MFFARRQCRFLLPPLLVVVLILAAAFPGGVRADDEGPTPGPTPLATDTPEVGPTDTNAADPAAVEGEITPEPADPSQNGTEVGISQDDQRISDAGEMSPGVLTSTLPIWCPIGVEPIAGQNGCTAEFGSISLLMDYLNSNSLGDQGQIWIPDSNPSADVQASSENPPKIEEGAVGDQGGGTGGVNVVILDNAGNSLPPDSEEATNALLNGQPIWCPDGIAPGDGGESCTSSSASMGLLVSMMENGSLQDGAIYIQAPESAAGVSENSSLPAQEANAEVIDRQDPTQTEAALANADDSSANVVLHDPIWCPSGVAPDPGVGGCTASFARLDLLVAYLSGLLIEPTLGDGEIWMEAGADASGPVSIDGTGLSLTTWRTKSLTFHGGWIGPPPGGLFPGDPTIAGNTTFGQSISIVGWQNGVVINNIIISGATGTGLTVQTTSGVALESVTSNNNSGAGIDIAATNGFITASNITTTGNGTYGTWLDNCQKILAAGTWTCSPSGSSGVSIIGTNNVFSQNGTDSNDRTHSGLIVSSNGDVSADNVVADQNKYYGVNITTMASVSVDTMTASQNRVGIRADNSVTAVAQPLTFRNIIANSNSPGAGLVLMSLGDISLDTASVASNGGRGIVLDNNAGTGGVDVQNVTVSTASPATANGMSVNSSAGIVVACSAFSSSGLFFGFDASNFTTLQINGVTFSGLGYTTAGPGTVTVDPSCTPSGASAGGGGTGKSKTFGNALLGNGGSGPSSLNIINLPGDDGTNPVTLNCEDFSGSQLSLPNGDRVTYLCPTTGEASLVHLDNTDGSLPAALPGNVVFMSAMQTHLTDGGIEQRLTSGNLEISFVIPVDMIGFNVTILYWDGSAWSDLSTTTFGDGRSVFGGGIKTEDGRFEAATNFPGTFVLVRK